MAGEGAGPLVSPLIGRQGSGAVTPLATRAPAKVNLTLHVLGRRADGYHALESLVAFAGVGDHLSLQPGPQLALKVLGPTGHLAGGIENNLVIIAARALQERVEGLRTGQFTLIKRLPIAAGIGGGSADAAAALRLLARLNALPLSHPAVIAAARSAGADVPVCVESRARMMCGAGESLGEALRLPPLFAVLVNPGVPVPTSQVFAALGLAPGEILAGSAHPIIAPDPDREALVDLLRETRNDLEVPARAVEPVVGRILQSLRASPACLLARMSGSGATVFGIYPDCRAAAAAARMLRRNHADWWVKSTILR